MYQINSKSMLVSLALVGLVTFLAIEPIQPAPNSVIYYRPVRNEYVQSWRPPVYRTYSYRPSNYPHSASAPMYSYQARPVSWTSQPSWSANRYVAPIVMRPRFQPVMAPSLRYVPRLSAYTPGRHLVGTTLKPTVYISSLPSIAAPTTPAAAAAAATTATTTTTASPSSLMPSSTSVSPSSTPLEVVSTTSEAPTTMLTTAYSDPVPTGNINSSNLSLSK